MFSLNTRILVIDDMSTMRKVIIKTLKEIGFTDFLEAADGNQGWDALQSASPSVQLVISDWNMPNCTGLELLKRVRGDARLRKLPFVLLTAEAEVEQVKEALMAGVSTYIVKPFSAEVLKTKLDQAHKKLAA
jgi:two-component system, chemotaxis family, chemotaxis protein CheY